MAELDKILGEYIAESSRVLHRMGVKSNVDDLVIDAIQRRDRARQRLGSGPISVEDLVTA